MIQPVKLGKKTLFEIETIDGKKYLKKKDKEVSKLVGKPVYVTKSFDEILSSRRPVIYLKLKD
ncbi:MAG: hypothetical protein DDT32_01646 [Syntrophomonadaceae bacterium]|nr:hypothetical protein [Bacillota bacterium]